ncbi:MAG: PAS domain S-box protein [Acidobacteriota bacterium]
MKRLGDWLRIIFEYSPFAYCLVDLNGILIDVNQTAARLFGRSRKELRGKRLSGLDIIAPDQAVKIESSFKSWKKGQPSGPDEFRLIRKDRGQIFVESRGFPLKRGDQDLALVVILDVTDRKLVELCVRFQSNLLDSVRQAVIATDLKGRVIYWNQFAETLYGWEPSEIIGASFTDIIPAPSSGAKARTAFKRLRRGESSRGELSVQRKNGTTFPAMVSTTPLRDPQGNIVGFACVSYDISAQKRAHEMLVLQRKALRLYACRILLTREEEKRRISANLHREIGHITGAMNLLSGSLEKNIRSNNLEGALESGGKFRVTFNNFVSNLRRLALELRPPELDVLGLSSALSDYLSNIEKETGLRVEFHAKVKEKEIRDTLPIVIFRIVQEAVNNILKHSQAKNVRVDLKSLRKAISLAIKDDGRGFDPQKTKKDGKSGMGLRLIREMVESLDGTFKIESSPGKGTRLLISLSAMRPFEDYTSLDADAAGASRLVSRPGQTPRLRSGRRKR